VIGVNGGGNVVEGTNGNVAANNVNLTFQRSSTASGVQSFTFTIAHAATAGAGAPLANGGAPQAVAPGGACNGSTGDNTGNADFLLNAGAGLQNLVWNGGTCTGTAEFTNAATTGTLTVTTLGDAVVERNESFTATVAAPVAPQGYTVGTGAAGSATSPAASVTITNDDNPTVTIDAAPVPASSLEDTGANMVYTFRRDSAALGDLVVNFNTNGSTARCQSGGPATDPTDYVLTGATTFVVTSGGTNCTGTVTFTGGSLTATVSADPQTDTLVETNETVVLNVAAQGGGAPGPYTVGGANSSTGTILMMIRMSR